MTALATERPTVQMGDRAIPDILELGVLDTVICWQGGVVVLESSSGYVRPAATATGLIALGIALKNADNRTTVVGHADGFVKCRIRQGVFKLANSGGGDAIARTEIGKDVYLVDDQTVAKTDGGGARSRAGKVVQVDSDGVWVQIGIGL